MATHKAEQKFPDWADFASRMQDACLEILLHQQATEAYFGNAYASHRSKSDWVDACSGPPPPRAPDKLSRGPLVRNLTAAHHLHR